MTASPLTAPPAAAIVASGGATKPGACVAPVAALDEAGTPAAASTPSARPRSGGVEALDAVRCLSPQLSPAATPSSALPLGEGAEEDQTTGRVLQGGRTRPVPTSILTAHGIDLVDGPCRASGPSTTVVRLAHAVSGACASGRWGCLVCGGFHGYNTACPTSLHGGAL